MNGSTPPTPAGKNLDLLIPTSNDHTLPTIVTCAQQPRPYSLPSQPVVRSHHYQPCQDYQRRRRSNCFAVRLAIRVQPVTYSRVTLLLSPLLSLQLILVQASNPGQRTRHAGSICFGMDRKQQWTLGSAVALGQESDLAKRCGQCCMRSGGPSGFFTSRRASPKTLCPSRAMTNGDHLKQTRPSNYRTSQLTY